MKGDISSQENIVIEGEVSGKVSTSGKLEMKKYKIFPLEIGKYYLEHLARKKAFLETKDEIVKAFAEYEKKLGEAGFSKI